MVSPPAHPRLRLRWVIVALLCGAAMLNYVDRLLLSLLAPTIQAVLGIDDRGYAMVVNFFLVAYLISYLGSGAVIDRIGARRSLAVCVSTWSVANALTSLARTVGSLAGCQFFLGLGEAGFWTACPKIVGDFFPPAERAIAVGLYTLGSTLGATLAPLIAVPLARRGVWQLAFVATGAVGLFWLLPWFKLSRRCSGPAGAGGPPPAVAENGAPAAGWGWRDLWRRPLVWRLLLGRMLTDPVWYFLQFWFAKYLFSARHLTQSGLVVTWWIFASASAATICGGLFSWRLVRRGARPADARLSVMRVCAWLVPSLALIPWVPSTMAAVALGAGVTFCGMSWQINLSALLIDCVPARSVATVFGVVAAGSAFGGMVMNSAVAGLIRNHTYAPCFVALAAVYPLAWLIVRPVAKGGNEPAPLAASPAEAIP